MSFSLLHRVIVIHQSLVRKKFRRQQEAFDRSRAVRSHRVTGFDEQRPSLSKVFSSMRGPKSWAYTSGTRKEPKAIPFDRKRTALVQKLFLKAMILLTARFKGLKTFFVFSSLNPDQSLTSGLTMGEKDPTHLELLQAPYRYLFTERGLKLRRATDDLSARLILILVTRPAFFYATNPSTLTHFLKDLELHWPRVAGNMKKILAAPEILRELLRLQDGNALPRLERAAAADTVPPFGELFSELKALITWDGGYVKPFLEQLTVLLPGVPQVPMYSMSTEAVETLPHLIDGRLHFLPSAPGVYYEFLDLEDQTLHLPQDLLPGKHYGLVVSDRWGLTRYDTQDIFLVKEVVDGLPDLAFVKRRGINSSLTGEKLTEEQILLLITGLKERFPELRETFFSLYPYSLQGAFGYELALIGRSPEAGLEEFTAQADRLLGEINAEYKSKVDSGRLLPLTTAISSSEKLAVLMGKGGQWESQFKILPLYDKIISKA